MGFNILIRPPKKPHLVVSFKGDAHFFKALANCLESFPKEQHPKTCYWVMELYIPKDTRFHEIWITSTPEEVDEVAPYSLIML
jgi:hypothetical protein